jgi:phenylpropionate dioxygenase-like ring-hydroxylating dioxygenase large terminal subunit
MACDMLKTPAKPSAALLENMQCTTENTLKDPLIRREWHIVARAADVADNKPLGVKLLGEDVVLWRKGPEIVAWLDLCIHRGARLSLGRVENGCLSCPYHGWTYDVSGQCVRIPAHPHQAIPGRAKANTLFCTQEYGMVWVAFEKPEAGVPAFPEWGRPDYRTLVRGPFRVMAQGPRIIENFLDLAHLAFVHPGILGDENRAEIGRYNVTSTADGVEADEIDIWQPDGVGTGQGGMAKYVYRVTRPLSAYLEKWVGDVHLTLMLAVAPVDEVSSTAWMIRSVNNVNEILSPELYQNLDRVFLQDVPIVESQRPEFLPLDLQAELHLNCDRTSIAYRQWLRQRGFVYGTA